MCSKRRSVSLIHCTFTKNEKTSSGSVVYNVAGQSLSVDNCLMTADNLDENCNQTITGSNRLETSYTYAIWFDKNILTFNYIMPMPGMVSANAPLLSGYETDAAGNIRSAGNCMYGAVNWSAISFVVKNNSDGSDTGPSDSLRRCVSDADAYPYTPLPNKYVIYFDNILVPDRTTITLTSGKLSYSRDIMIIGRLDNEGKPAITIDARVIHR